MICTMCIFSSMWMWLSLYWLKNLPDLRSKWDHLIPYRLSIPPLWHRLAVFGYFPHFIFISSRSSPYCQPAHLFEYLLRNSASEVKHRKENRPGASQTQWGEQSGDIRNWQRETAGPPSTRHQQNTTSLVSRLILHSPSDIFLTFKQTLRLGVSRYDLDNTRG